MRTATTLLVPALLSVPFLFTPSIFSQDNPEFAPLLPAEDLDQGKVALGRALFHEPKLSRDHTVSCASCHVLDAGGDDGRRVSLGIGGAQGLVNAPTVFNSDLSVAQFWDGRATTLADQVDGPIQNPLEMDNDWGRVVSTLYGDPAYTEMFSAVFPDQAKPISRATVKESLAEYQRSLRTPGSRFDRYLEGDTSVFNELEVEGLRLFRHYGCVSCHQGAAMGGNLFQKFGVINEYFAQRGNITPADQGRFAVTGNIEDMHAFKVPSLRLVAFTAPYLHDGTAQTLADAVRAMFRFQLGVTEFPEAHVTALVAFLKTLAGSHPELGSPEPDPDGLEVSTDG